MYICKYWIEGKVQIVNFNLKPLNSAIWNCTTGVAVSNKILKMRPWCNPVSAPSCSQAMLLSLSKKNEDITELRLKLLPLNRSLQLDTFDNFQIGSASLAQYQNYHVHCAVINSLCIEA